MDEPSIAASSGAETDHKIGHKSARGPRIEVIARNDRRRTWTLDQKREIVAESLGPGLTPTEVARKHAISSGQLYTWRQQVLGGQMTMLSHGPPDFAQVEMAPAPRPPGELDDKNSVSVPPPRSAGLIEITLPSGVMLRVDATVDATTLRRVLTALDRR
ncbi:MAG: transposase [Acetobacteraceae bacterium]